MLYLCMSFSAKEPYNPQLFCGKRPAKASYASSPTLMGFAEFFDEITRIHSKYTSYICTSLLDVKLH